VIQAFGKLIMQGNFVIGLIVFAILVIVNFVVITKGSGRIAEVAARFTLDAMPGKQMAWTPICRPGSSTKRKPVSAASVWKRNRISSAPWTALRSSCAATRLPA
jgi:hypothetical protein